MKWVILAQFWSGLNINDGISSKFISMITPLALERHQRDFLMWRQLRSPGEDLEGWMAGSFVKKAEACFLSMDSDKKQILVQ
ncbi:hypothetical protein ACOSP7_016967 [Xanthoceras sorbifolium]|uniref:Uncharacterized protein n=1 Tax=Xanthoceras sorbifolium TaxID=99658 RepID=A0ABQ8HI08_9ROSI|nr:hypothetical protein JRO89_XS10G0077800 [Xanthoceras sorbifolium]